MNTIPRIPTQWAVKQERNGNWQTDDKERWMTHAGNG